MKMQPKSIQSMVTKIRYPICLRTFQILSTEMLKLKSLNVVSIRSLQQVEFLATSTALTLLLNTAWKRFPTLSGERCIPGG